MKYAEEHRRIYTPAARFFRNTWRGYINHGKRYFDERKAKKEQESAADRAARVTANATVAMAIFTVVPTLKRMGASVKKHTGNIDTHTLAKANIDASNAASDQADAAQQFSDTA